MKKTNKIKFRCDNCNVIVYRFKSHYDGHKYHFCSNKCRWNYICGKRSHNWTKRLKIKCDNCNLIIERIKTRIKKRNFCNFKCKKEWQAKWQYKYVNFKGSKNPFWKGGKVKFNCDYCGRLAYQHKCQYKNQKHHFCNMKCKGKWFSKNKKGKNSYSYQGKEKLIKCSYCGKKMLLEKWRYNRVKLSFCNFKCYGKWLSKNKKGKDSPCYSKIKTKCNYCSNVIYVKKHLMKQHKYHFCNRKCSNKYFVGKNATSYIDGNSLFPYPLSFNNRLKGKIRNRDNNKCQLCGVPQQECLKKLHVHHIDYDKQNCDPVNLLTLCNRCNCKVNYNRDYWINYFQKIQIERKVHLLEMEVEL